MGDDGVAIKINDIGYGMPLALFPPPPDMAVDHGAAGGDEARDLETVHLRAGRPCRDNPLPFNGPGHEPRPAGRDHRPQILRTFPGAILPASASHIVSVMRGGFNHAHGPYLA